MNKPLASFVCLTYNRQTLLNEILYCFLAQDYENKELIILNDNALIDYYYNDPRVKIFNIKNRFVSLGEKRNFSRAITNGEFIFITDDDDIYYSNHISRLLSYHLDNLDFDIISNTKAHYSEHNNFVQDWNVNVAFNGACIRKEYWLNNEFPKDKSCGEDQDFIKNAKIFHIDDDITTFHYRWGLNIHHISQMGGDGQDSYKYNGQLILNYKQKIALTPTLSELASKYYK